MSGSETRNLIIGQEGAGFKSVGDHSTISRLKARRAAEMICEHPMKIAAALFQ